MYLKGFKHTLTVYIETRQNLQIVSIGNYISFSTFLLDSGHKKHYVKSCETILNNLFSLGTNLSFSQFQYSDLKKFLIFSNVDHLRRSNGPHVQFRKGSIPVSSVV